VFWSKEYIYINGNFILNIEQQLGYWRRQCCKYFPRQMTLAWMNNEAGCRAMSLPELYVLRPSTDKHFPTKITNNGMIVWTTLCLLIQQRKNNRPFIISVKLALNQSIMKDPCVEGGGTWFTPSAIVQLFTSRPYKYYPTKHKSKLVQIQVHIKIDCLFSWLLLCLKPTTKNKYLVTA
jgi:hypothetical protein